ncbi:hypothetical protein PIB30_034932 [Stylosanthes scabra]|uniref:Uncharacterized protein n=1 Tax=Stylosanthes scabra TaxID=79078 RepID=A0ABU6WAZ4_9FABA|nr:hypothetical protein [Stylosanthes scabra]
MSDVFLDSKVVSMLMNNMSGSVPRVSPNVTHLDLSYNNLYEMSSFLCQKMKEKGNLETLFMYDNALSGEIPNCWMNWRSLLQVELGYNNLIGEIPHSIGLLSRLIFLSLEENKLSGKVSLSLRNCKNLQYLSLSGNAFSGGVSSNWIGQRIKVLLLGSNQFNVYDIDLSRNNLSGTIPRELFMLTRLQSLNLSHNMLFGVIPRDVGNLTQLESLDLSSNLFSGQIPQSISGLSFLEVLNLSYNNFEGKIPSGTQLEGFTNLSYVGNPKLCGSPLAKICPQDEKPTHGEQRREEEEDDENSNSEVHSWFFMGLVIGFATSFWGVLGAIFFNTRFRDAYFRYLDEFHDIVIHKVIPIS